MPKRKPTHSTDSDGDGDGASAGKGKKIKAVKAVKDDGKEEFWEVCVAFFSLQTGGRGIKELN